MQLFKLLLSSMLVLFVATSIYAESWEFDPQNCTAKLETDHIWFQDNGSEPAQIGPELYAEDTNADFFTFVKNAISTAIANNNKIILQFSNIDSQNHGQYDCIIPDS